MKEFGRERERELRNLLAKLDQIVQRCTPGTIEEAEELAKRVGVLAELHRMEMDEAREARRVEGHTAYMLTQVRRTAAAETQRAYYLAKLAGVREGK